MGQWRNAMRSIIILASFLALTGVVALAADLRAWVNIYAVRFAFAPGSWFAERLAKTENEAETCLVIGASTAREAFDPRILEESLPHLSFLNAATTGGNIEVLEVQSEILARYGMHYHCIVAGVHPWLMFAEGAPELVATGYISHLGPLQLAALVDRSWTETEGINVVQTLAIPFAKQAQQLSRLARYALYRANERLRSSPLPLSRYESFSDELNAPNDFAYVGAPNYLRDSREKMQTYYAKFQQDQSFNHVEISHSFSHAIDTLTAAADFLFVAVLPDSELLNRGNMLGRPAFDAVIGRFKGKVIALDCTKGVSESLFVDPTHVNAEGRAALSRSLAGQLSQYVGGNGVTTSGPCVLVTTD